MTALRLRAHNQGDRGVETGEYDVACLTERSPTTPDRVVRHSTKLLKGLAIDYDPKVFEVHKSRFAVAHPGIPKRSPRRGTLWIKATHIPTGAKVAVVCSHRINNASGPATRPKRWLAEKCWAIHTRLDTLIFKRLIAKGFVVLYGGDINDRADELKPLTRVARTFGRYDAIGFHVADIEELLVEKTTSDHAAFTATFEIPKP